MFKTTRPDLKIRTGRVEELREKHEESNFLKFEIPIVLVNNAKGAKHIVIDHVRLLYYLNLCQSDIIALRDSGLIQTGAPIKVQQPRIDYLVLSEEYQKKLDGGDFSTRAALARSLGVSRAWISMVLNRM